MPTTKLAKHGWKLSYLAIAAFYLFGLGSLPLVGPDEPRYAEVAREMFARHDWITPTLGGHPWFEKPALLYWMMIVSYRVLGVSEYAARLGPALCGLLTAVFIFWLGRTVARANQSTERENPSALGEWSTLVFLSSLGAIAFSRAASFDIVLTMALTGALCCFFVWHTENATRRNRRWLLVAFYFFIGLSLLAKGLVGIVLPLGTIAVHFIIRRAWPNKTLLLSLLWGLPIALIVASTWYGPMIYRHGWTFVDQFIIQHHFARFLSNKYHHPQPIYFYLPTIAWLCVPWTLLLISGVVRSTLDMRASASAGHLRSFAVSWIVVPTLFFSLSSAKLPGYILPVLPAAALLVGYEIDRYVKGKRNIRLMRVTASLMIVTAAAGAVYASKQFGIPRLFVASGVTIAVVTGGVGLLFRKQSAAAAGMLALASLAISAVAVSAARGPAARDSVRDLIHAADARGYSSAPVFYLLCDDRTGEFYASGRLAYDPTGEPTRFEGAQDVATAIRARGGFGIVLIETRWETQLADYRAVTTEKITDNGRISVFAVRVVRSIEPGR